MKYTDIQLKQALAKMLPETYAWYVNPQFPSQATLRVRTTGYEVLDTELLHLCWLVEETLMPSKRLDYVGELMDNQGLDLWQRYHATWQQRVQALCKVKGIVIS